MLNIFFITPLSFVGGVFNTVDMLPPGVRWLAYGNPFFYFINGIRGAMIGGFILGIVEIFVAGYISSSYRDFVAFSLLLVLLIFRPTGILGRPQLKKV